MNNVIQIKREFKIGQNDVVFKDDTSLSNDILELETPRQVFSYLLQMIFYNISAMKVLNIQLA